MCASVMRVKRVTLASAEEERDEVVKERWLGVKGLDPSMS